MAVLSCGGSPMLAWDVVAGGVHQFMTINDTIVPECIRLPARRASNDPVIEAGESAVAGLASLNCGVQRGTLREILDLNGNSRVLLIGSEGVTDPDIYARIMN